jgi:Fe-S cluster assembly scaffold protein SufB
VPEQGREFVLSASQRQRLPMEYAVEMNRLIEPEMESSIG